MAQTIKFVYEDGKVRLQNTHVDLTKTVIKSLQHDYSNQTPNNKVKYFTLTDGEFAPEPKKKPFKHYHHAGKS